MSIKTNKMLFVTSIALIGLIFGIIAGCGSKNVKPVADPDDQLKIAMKLYEKEKYYEAETEFQKFIYNYPGNKAVDTAQYYLGMSYYKDGDYALAAGEFKKFLTSFPASDFADDAQYHLAMSHYHQSPGYELDQSETRLAIDEFLNFLDGYPLSEHADSASVKLTEMRNKLAKKTFKTGRLYQKLNQFDPAILYYNRLITEYPESPYVEESVFRKGECYLKLEKDIKAREAFLEYLNRFENGKYHGDVVDHLRDLEDKPKAEL
ncbi:MAG: outer membrane protein assembly factor BamD [candidate division Zixibacteria bacterium]|nr:outer membrane protein assembly factor BamD [candidate division Zixibacteria bacterium]